LIQAQIHSVEFENLDELTECELKVMTKMYATDLQYDSNYQVYTVEFEDHNWMLANLRMPGLDKILRKAT